MSEMVHIATVPMWASFIAFIFLMLLVDLFVVGGNKPHKVGIKEAATWSIVWLMLALLFNAGLWWHVHTSYGNEIATQKALEFLTGYLIEKSLSVDNLFVFLMIFTSFHVDAKNQHKVLIYGVLGAIVLRFIMILAGAWVVEEFKWVLYIFGGFLLVTGLRMLLAVEHTPNLQRNPVVRFVKRHIRLTDDYHDDKFTVKLNGIRYFTPLFLVLIIIELSDVVFAVDSIPAIFAITTDPFIVFTSNIFAILGLRSLYFLLADMADRFHLLKFGLAMTLIFIGSKMLIMPWYHVPVAASLTVVVVLIGSSILASFILKKR